MRDREATRAIRELAERQHGIISRAQLLRLGLGHRLIEARARAGFLATVHDGVFALGHKALGREAQWLAAVLASGAGAVLSHGSAAELWGIGKGGRRVEVTRRSGGTTGSGIWVHQTRFLPDDHTAVAAGIPVTSVERTVLDMAARTGRHELERMVVDADRAGALDWPRLHRVIEWGSGRRGWGRMRRVAFGLDPRGRDTRSPLEVDFLAMCGRAGLPPPQVNVLVEGYLVDFLWPEQRLVVETDGYMFHADRRAFERDRERDLDLTAAGYEVNRMTYRMLKRDPQRCAQLVRAALTRRGASNPPPARGRI